MAAAGGYEPTTLRFGCRYQLSAAAMAFGSSGKRKRSVVATQHEDDQAGRDGSDNEAANVDETNAGEEYINITIEHEEEERADIGKRNPLLEERADIVPKYYGTRPAFHI
ncbi:hypothetical protein E2562_019205 [Oryza meyeriana var. granulata]|uniref:Uncharacterized protein n=1 Tax=Oryza meyeriana var. granulata TaxID=110450 RepID=A0A6G1F9X9_9ORYZ|nr:hypothetical protein E2562_019205 [Oryza meyeriana var. granulata]